MAFTTLGEFSFPPLPTTKTTKKTSVNATRSYKFILDFTPEIPQNVFSDFRVSPILYQRSGNFVYFDSDYYFDPLKSPRVLYVGLSRHYTGFVKMALEIERVSKYYFGGEEGNIKLKVSIESRTYGSYRP